MAEPVITSAAIMAALVSTTKVLESASNLIQGLQATAELIKAQEGLKYNNYVFDIPKDVTNKSDEEIPASAASSKNKKSSTLLLGKVVARSPQGIVKPFLKITNYKGLSESWLCFGVAIRKPNADSDFENGQVVLLTSKGFDTSIGDQAELEFSGTSWGDNGYLLAFRGQINIMGPGFDVISGAVLIKKDGTLKPQGSWLKPNGLFWNSKIIEQSKFPWNADFGFVLKYE